MFGAIIIGLYALSLIVIFCYAVIQFVLAASYLKAKNKLALQVTPNLKSFPFVTIQLPVYNEKYVVERLIRKSTEIEWPKDKLEIQILDDSTDETIEIINLVAAELKQYGFHISVIRRSTRVGYKAGALKNGLDFSSGEFIAIFDADFIPETQFLKKTIPLFEDKKVGLVQTRWEHINRNYSILTKLQAFALDAHFTAEQVGRNVNHYFINFNGTAGVWRRTAIEDGGGWQSDTLTEDLDLSYRAQIKGWKFIYRGDIGSPAELPITMSALKSQQFRWTKGGAETFKKMAGKLITTPDLKLGERINGLAHLFNSSVFVFVLILALSSVALVYLVTIDSLIAKWLNYAMVFFLSTIFLIFYYAVSFREKHANKISTSLFFIVRFFQFLIISMGLSYHNSIAVLEGYVGRKTAFIRTPKFNLKDNGDLKTSANSYQNRKLNLSTFAELILFMVFVFGIVLGIKSELYGMIPFHVMAAVGFLSVFIFSITESTRT